jgi:outer membrane protein TolC
LNLRSRIYLLGGLALWAVPAAAQPAPGTLGLEDCVRLARSAQSSVTIARQQLEIARYGVVQAKADFFPQASLGSTFTYNSPLHADRSTFSYVSLNGIREYSSLAGIGLELDTSGRLRAQLARARADREAAAAGAALSERDLRRAVAASYYRVLLARRLVQVTRDNLAEARSFEQRSRLLARNGEAAEADVVKAAAQVAFFEQAVNAAELDARLANHELASFWTTDVEAVLPLDDILARPVPAPPAPAPPGAPYLRRPEFRLLEAQRRGFQADARRARAALLPQLSLVAQYGLDSTRVTLADRGYASFLHLNVPVFDWFRARSAARQFDLQARQAAVNRDIAERVFSREYRDALARVELLYSQIAIAERQVRLSEDNLRLSRVRYEGGEGAALDVVAAQSQVAQARANFFSAEVNYLNARVDLEVTAGR